MQAITKVFSDIVKPYIDTVKQALTQQINYNGAKNYVSQDAGSVTKNGITFTNNGDGTYTVSGTNTSTSAQTIYPNEATPILLKAGQKYTLSGGVSSSLSLQVRKDMVGTNYTDADGNIVSIGSAAKSFTNGNSDVYVYILLRVAGSATVNGTVKPMLCLKSDYDLAPTFVPYAKSNKELTEDATPEYFDLSVRSSRVSIVAQKNCRIGKQVYLWCRFTPIVSGDILPAFSVPSGYRPPNVGDDIGIIIGMKGLNTSQDLTKTRYATVFSTGEVDVVNVAQDGDYMIYGSYFIN